MATNSASHVIRNRVGSAAIKLDTVDPWDLTGETLSEWFSLPYGDQAYAHNYLTPGATAFEPSFSGGERDTLRFTVDPTGPGALPQQKRDDATREARRLIDSEFGSDALRWFDRSSEQWRPLFSHPRLYYGAFFGTGFDRNGLQSTKVYYELEPGDLSALPSELRQLVAVAINTMPGLIPVFTTITAYRDQGRQRVTFLHPGPLRLADLGPLMQRLNLENQLPAIMQLVGLALGGRFTLPHQSVLVGLSGTVQDPELKLEVLMGMIEDIPAEMPELLRLGLTERPRQLRAMERWYEAFTPEEVGWPGNISVLSIRVSRNRPPGISVYLRPVEFEMTQSLLRAGMVPQEVRA